MAKGQPSDAAPTPAVAAATKAETGARGARARHRQRRRGWQLGTAGMFLAFLAVADLDLVVKVDRNPSPTRERVQFPTLHIDRSLRQFPGKVVWYVKSSMGFRGALVRARGLLAWDVLGVSPIPEAAVRADPWLFMRSERVFDDFRRVDVFSDAELAAWSGVLEARRVWLADRGIRYVVVLAPNKETIYAEAVPAWATRDPRPSRMEQLVTQLRATSHVDVVDLSATIAAHKGDGRLYHYTDTHWNDRGAFIGYRAVAARLATWFPGLSPLAEADTFIEERTVPGGDLARICGLQLDRTEPQLRIHVRDGIEDARLDDGSPLTFERMDVRFKERIVTVAPQGEIASAILLRDSFGEALIPYLARHFRRATWLWTTGFPEAMLDEQRPSVVIQQLVERKLMVLAPGARPSLPGPRGPSSRAR